MQKLNKRGVGAAVRTSKIKQEEIFTTSKIRAEYKELQKRERFHRCEPKDNED